jgi:hypothetical protein
MSLPSETERAGAITDPGITWEEGTPANLTNVTVENNLKYYDMEFIYD